MPDISSELRVFISSTFRDLQSEREELIKKVFPEIRALCRARGITFTEVDLRWGITDDEQRDGSVIRTCLDEVARCTPYFIGILGTRHGWAPTAADIAIDPALLDERPWIADAVREGMSLTAMEFAERLRDSSTSKNALVYKRSGKGLPRAEAGVEQLASRCVTWGCHVQDFETPAELGSLVRADLLSIVDAFDAADTAPTPLEHERRAHAAFAASRAHGYVERVELISAFDDWMRDGSTPLLVRGASGLGKSSLIASLAASLRTRSQDAFVLEHYTGASDASTSVEGMIRHILESIREGFALDEPVPDARQELEDALQSWLLRLDHIATERGRSAVIFIDAIDNLEERGRSMAWLPERLPASLRLVLSSRSGAVADTLASRGFATLDVVPLDIRAVRETIVTRYLGGYHKRVAHAELDRITSAASAGSPLFLRVVAEELRLHGEHETIADVVDRYCAARDVDELFTLVLDRVERDFGRKHVESMLSLLFAARNGLSEHELLEISKLNRIELSRLLFAFDFHLIRRDALLSFFHDHLRSAVERRYMSSSDVLRARHRDIGDYFSAQPYDARRRAEEPWQWMRAGAHDRAVDALCDPELFALLNESRVRHELIGYWRELGVDPIAAYDDVRTRMRRERIPTDKRIAMIEGVAELLIASARFNAAEQLLRTAYRYRRLTLGADAAQTIVAADLLATAIFHAGRYDECEQLWRAALESAERVHGDSDPALCSILDSLATCAQLRGKSEAMTTYADRSLSISSTSFGRSHPSSIERLMNVAAIKLSQRMFDEAIAGYEEAAAIALRTFGELHPATTKCKTELGFALTNAGRWQESIPILHGAAANTELLLGEHIALARALEAYGHPVALSRDYDTAERTFRNAYRIRTTLQGEDHPDAMFTLSRIAVVMRRSGKPHEAERIIRQLLPKQIAICGPRDTGVLQSVGVLIQILKMTNRDEEASQLQRQYETADAPVG